MAAPARLSLGRARTGWVHLIPQLQTFGRTCEAIVQGTIAFELTDDAYIGRACFRLTGDVRRLDASVFAKWVAACPWPCTFAPAHDGYPCIFVSPGDAPGSRSWGAARGLTRVAIVLLVSIAASAWAEAQTPPVWVPSAVHACIGHPGGIALWVMGV